MFADGAFEEVFSTEFTCGIVFVLLFELDGAERSIFESGLPMECVRGLSL